MTPVETLTHNNKLIEIYPDTDPRNPREEYDHVGTLSLHFNKHLSDKGEEIGDKEDWLLVMIDLVDSKTAERIEHIDELIERVVDQRLFISKQIEMVSYLPYWADPTKRPEGLLLPDEAKDEETLLAWRHQLELLEKAHHVLPDLMLSPLMGGLRHHFHLVLSDTTSCRVSWGWSPDKLLKDVRTRAIHRHWKHTDGRLAILRDGRKRLIEEALNRHYIALPVTVYDHGGYSIRSSSPSWDPEECDGWIWVERKKAEREWSGDCYQVEQHAVKCLAGEVEEYDQYLTGQVYGFVIREIPEDEDEEGREIDSCWGFYGFDHCLEAAKENC